MDFKTNPRTSFKALATMSCGEAAREAEALRAGIAYHDHLYYVKNSPRISDAVYDKLFRRLQDLESAFPELQRADSPTSRVGAEPVSRLKKARHEGPMLSLHAVREVGEVEDFVRFVRRAAGDADPPYALEPKFDGFSVEVVYRQGRFRRAVTRGNGDLGEDISHNLKTVGAVPLVLRRAQTAPERLAVRGEVFMRRQGFQALNKARVERDEDAFANPRNAAAGVMRQLDSRKVAGLPLDVYFYEVLDWSGEPPQSHRALLGSFQRWGLKTCPENGRGAGLDDIRRYHARLARRRDKLEYEIDGIVVEVDDYALRGKLGVRARSPRWAVAWKFEPRAEETTVEDIVVQVGRSGILTPVALLQPVDVGGVTVSRATLHNADEVRRKDIRVGDRVRLVRAGDVIPEVEARVKQSGRRRQSAFAMPSRCPVCGSRIVREGAFHRCPAGLSCPAQLTGRIRHFASRNAMDIAHLGGKTARQLVERGLVNDLADLYRLDRETLESLEGFAAKSAGQLYESIQASRQPRLDAFLYALGIPHIGRRTARMLAEKFRSLEALRKAEPQAVEAIEGLGSEVAEALATFFAERENRDVLARMRRAGVEVKRMPERGRQPLADTTVVLTGRLAHYTREEARRQVERLGGHAASSVSGRTDYVVVGEDPGAKAEQARSRGVKVLDEDEFRSLIGDA